MLSGYFIQLVLNILSDLIHKELLSHSTTRNPYVQGVKYVRYIIVDRIK